MFDASPDDDEIPFSHFRDAVAEIDRDPSAQHEEGLVFVCMRVPVELSAEFRDLDLGLVDVADDERMKDFPNLAVDRLKDVDLEWGHRPAPSLRYDTLTPSASPRSRFSAPRRRGRRRESRRGRNRAGLSCRDRR